MKLNNVMIEKAAATKDVRYYLQQPYLDAEKSHLVATTGSIMAVCPVQLDEGDTTGWIASDAIKAARKLSGRKGLLSIKANGSLDLENGQKFPREDLGRYPDYSRVIPDKDKATTVISLDAKLLKDLADAICTPGDYAVKLHITDANTAVYVESNSDNFGVIMPVRMK